MNLLLQGKSLSRNSFFLPTLLLISLNIQVITFFLPGKLKYVSIGFSAISMMLVILVLRKVNRMVQKRAIYKSKNIFRSLQQLEQILESSIQEYNELNRIMDAIDKHDSAKLDIRFDSELVDKGLDVYHRLKNKEIKNMEREAGNKVMAWLEKGQNRMADVLRKNNTDIEIFARKVINELLSYTNACLGQFYMPSKNNQECLQTLYCYGGKKCSYQSGEGTVGTVFRTQKAMLLKKGDTGHVLVSSSLGSASPVEVYCFPLAYNNIIYAVIEIGTFEGFRKDQLEYIDRVSMDIVVTLANLIVNQNNMKLYEQSKKQMKELQEKENELRQNFEELQATQEEMTAQKMEIENTQILLNNIIDHMPFPVFVKDENSRYIMANAEQGRLFGVSPQKLINRPDEYFITDQKEIEEVRKSDKKVLKEKKKLTLPEQKISFADGSSHILQTIKIPLDNNITRQTNILGISFDLSALRTKDKKLKEAQQTIAELEQKIISGRPGNSIN